MSRPQAKPGPEHRLALADVAEATPRAALEASDAVPPSADTPGELVLDWEPFIDWFVGYWQRRAKELWIPEP